jgi:serine/threonine-protein kinase
VACKKLNDTAKQQSTAFSEFMQEAKLMNSIPASNYVVRFIGICREPFCLLSEYVDGGALLAYLQKPISLNLGLLIGFLRDIANGLTHLHQNGIIHRLVIDDD